MIRFVETQGRAGYAAMLLAGRSAGRVLDVAVDVLPGGALGRRALGFAVRRPVLAARLLKIGKLALIDHLGMTLLLIAEILSLIPAHLLMLFEFVAWIWLNLPELIAIVVRWRRRTAPAPAAAVA